ncbi:MAG: 4-hydroxy-3-methylbut-2-enyl diphosphate reductase [Deltaproteobacteria bacterium]|nr:4-hydroxy-3-methylbut-2-enyl diphosphate reductase [Deltaproteobacteria bacterium]
MRILLASPRGFCAGVDRAIEIVELALQQGELPVYVRHEIVHNRHVVDGLRNKGATFIEEPEDAPEGAMLIYSAHGVSPAIRRRAEAKQLQTIDATCPLVTKVHNEVRRMVAEGYQIVMIGHEGHVEVEGTMGQAPESMHLVVTAEDVARLEIPDTPRLGCVTQTTLSVDDTSDVMEALAERFPKIVLPKRDDICYATQNRQDAVKELAVRVDLVLVVGAPASSNSNRLVEVASRLGVSSFLIQNADDVDPTWLEGADCVGITAGASTPDVLVKGVIERIGQLAEDCVQLDSLPEVDEGVRFNLPRELRDT